MSVVYAVHDGQDFIHTLEYDKKWTKTTPHGILHIPDEESLLELLEEDSGSWSGKVTIFFCNADKDFLLFLSALDWDL